MDIFSALLITGAIVFATFKICGRIERNNWILGAFESNFNTIFRLYVQESVLRGSKERKLIWFDPTDPKNKHSLERPVDGNDASVGDTVRLYVPLKVRKGKKKVDLYKPEL